MPNLDRTIVVCPGSEDDTHPSGLYLDTRMRLCAAAVLYKRLEIGMIVVGGSRLRKMKSSFATLMKNYLVAEYRIPDSSIMTEEQTFDTASQIAWLSKNMRRFPGRVEVLTDRWQGLHVEALLSGYSLRSVEVRNLEAVILSIPRDQQEDMSLRYSLGRSVWWPIREYALASFTRRFDRRGKLMQWLTRSRKTKSGG